MTSIKTHEHDHIEIRIYGKIQRGTRSRKDGIITWINENRRYEFINIVAWIDSIQEWVNSEKWIFDEDWDEIKNNFARDKKRKERHCEKKRVFPNMIEIKKAANYVAQITSTLCRKLEYH